ncbi:hypothetical protein BTJ45_05691 [Bacillus mycoides]|nr:hypothetical protein BTJ45_05691 [Bacillus mycoides]
MVMYEKKYNSISFKRCLRILETEKYRYILIGIILRAQ